jgi:stearoyl-CoA desaturase (delta-9 desaturase)
MPLEPHSPVGSVEDMTTGERPEASVDGKVRFNAANELPSPVSFCRGLTVVGCTLLIKHVWDLSHVASGVLIISAACLIENQDRGLYAIISCATPLFMLLHLLLTGRIVSLSQLAIFMPITLLFIGIPMSVCLHRYFSHKAFETSRAVQFCLGLVACLAYQGGPLWWAAIHVSHHHHCDKPADPHSAKQRGSLYAFIGWTTNPNNYVDIDMQMRLLDASLLVPEMFLIEKVNPAPPLIVCCVVNYYFGYTTMFYSVLLPMLACRLITLGFNVEFHPVEGPKICKAIDNKRLLAVIVGESYHEDHHRRPRRSRRPDMDIPWWLTISWMEASGVIWNCK